MAPKRNMLPCQDNALNTLIKNIRINFVRLIIVLKGLILKVRVLKIYALLTFCAPFIHRKNCVCLPIQFIYLFCRGKWNAFGQMGEMGRWIIQCSVVRTRSSMLEWPSKVNQGCYEMWFEKCVSRIHRTKQMWVQICIWDASVVQSTRYHDRRKYGRRPRRALKRNSWYSDHDLII